MPPTLQYAHQKKKKRQKEGRNTKIMEAFVAGAFCFHEVMFGYRFSNLQSANPEKLEAARLSQWLLLLLFLYLKL